jgi:Lsr2
MARRTVVTLEDDVGGGPADVTLRFGIDGAEYEIDLSEKNAARFRNQLAPFIEHARRAGRRSRRAVRTAASRQRSRDIRVWAKGRGIELSARGRIPADVVTQYEAASRKTSRRLPPRDWKPASASARPGLAESSRADAGLSQVGSAHVGRR